MTHPSSSAWLLYLRRWRRSGSPSSWWALGSFTYSGEGVAAMDMRFVRTRQLLQPTSDAGANAGVSRVAIVDGRYAWFEKVQASSPWHSV